LVELLVVLGTLLIISAIALANFQDALIRAQLARVASDQRVLSMAIEAYHSDNGSYPRMAHTTFYGDPEFDSIGGIPVNGLMSRVLSTPVAYITNSLMLDPFLVRDKLAPIDQVYYTYQELDAYQSNLPASNFWPAARKFYGPWRLISVGPDLVFDHKFANSSQLLYDPTNGSVSLGNIIRSPNNSGVQAPVPLLLGPH
jgi:type II secretory pathway pseudopilin PulG